MEKRSELWDEKDAVVCAIIGEIKAGDLEAKELSKQIRQGCVEVLMLQGFSAEIIEFLLDTNTKIINRDLTEIRERNSKKSETGYTTRVLVEVDLATKTSRVVRYSRRKTRARKRKQ